MIFSKRPMTEPKPFFPLDKPRSWVIFVSATLLGLAIGLTAFAAAWFDVTLRRILATSLFVACWLVAAVCWCIFMIRQGAGRYRDIEPKPWKDQIW